MPHAGVGVSAPGVMRGRTGHLCPVPPTRVILAEPSTLVRSLLRVAIAGGRGETMVVGETGRAAELVALVVGEQPDVVVANTDFPDGELEGVLPELLDTGARVLVIARQASPERLTGLLAGGAAGYLVHDTAPEAVLDAVVAVGRGEVALHPVAASLVVDQWRRLRGAGNQANARLALTPREVEVLAAMADGLSNKAIARRLGVVVKTVENHKTRVFDKLGVKTQAHAVGLAISQGLLAELGTRPDPTPVGGA